MTINRGNHITTVNVAHSLSDVHAIQGGIYIHERPGAFVIPAAVAYLALEHTVEYRSTKTSGRA